MRKSLRLNDFNQKVTTYSFQILKQAKTIKIVFVLIMTLFTFSEAYSQSTEDWTLSAEQGGVKIYHQKSYCDDEPVVLLKFENNSSDSVNVVWDEYIKLEGVEDELKLNPNAFSIALEPGVLEANSCENVKVLQLVSRPNRLYSIFYENHDKGEIPNVPTMAIETYRIDGVIVTSK